MENQFKKSNITIRKKKMRNKKDIINKVNSKVGIGTRKTKNKNTLSDIETDSEGEVYEHFSDSDSDDSVIGKEVEDFLKENNFDKFKNAHDLISEDENATDEIVSVSKKRKPENLDTSQIQKFKKIYDTENEPNKFNEQGVPSVKKLKGKKKTEICNSTNIERKNVKLSIDAENVKPLSKKLKGKKTKINKSNSIDTKLTKKLDTQDELDKFSCQQELLPKKLKGKKSEINNSNKIDKKKLKNSVDSQNKSKKSICQLESSPKNLKTKKIVDSHSKKQVKESPVAQNKSGEKKFNLLELQSILNSNGECGTELPHKKKKVKETLQVCPSTEPYNINVLKNKSSKDEKSSKKKEEITSRGEKYEVSKKDSFKEKLKKKLQAASFRLINEEMYTLTGSDAYNMFSNDPEAFKIYHEGYNTQVSQWPINPVTVIATWLKKKPKKWVVADFGCGEASLAKSIHQKTHSLDLVASNPDVIVCDMSHTPLDTASVDVVVFCLSLMGTNLTDFLLEANRVLVERGVLKIAEVESRFDADATSFCNAMWKLGFRCIHKDQSEKYFWLFDFLKVKDVNKESKIRLPEIKLQPCIYKKR